MSGQDWRLQALWVHVCLSCFLSLSENASRTFIYYEKIIHAWGQKNGPRSNQQLQEKSYTFVSSDRMKNCGNHSLHRDTHQADACVQGAPNWAGLHRRPFPDGTGINLTAPPGLMAWGRSDLLSRAGLGSEEVRTMRENPEVKAAATLKGEGLRRGCLSPIQQFHGVCCPACCREHPSSVGT